MNFFVCRITPKGLNIPARGCLQTLTCYDIEATLGGEFVKVGCGFRFLLRKKSKSSTHPTTPGFSYVSRWVAGFVFYCVKNRNPPPTLQPRDFLMCVCHGGQMPWAAPFDIITYRKHASLSDKNWLRQHQHRFLACVKSPFHHQPYIHRL